MKTLIQFLQTKYPTILWALTIFILCTLPSKHLPKTNDKLAHFVVFAALSFLAIFYSRKEWLVLLLCILYGIAIEFWQKNLPESFHRGFDWYDALADGVGAIIGWIIWRTFYYFAKNQII